MTPRLMGVYKFPQVVLPIMADGKEEWCRAENNQ